MEVKRSFYTTFSQPLNVEKVEEVACNLCGSARFRLLGVEQGFQIRRCADCTLVYVSPQPAREELPKFYEGMYAGETDEGVEARSLGLVEPHIRRIVQREKPEGGKLLEIGCGYGRQLRALRDLPFELHGTEVSETALQHVHDTVTGVDLRLGTIEDVDYEPDAFDAIIAIAVLEHVKDPKAVLARVTRWLAPGGLLLMQVPYIQHFFRLKQWLKPLPVHFEAPRHLFDFSPTTLPRYFREAGLEHVRTEIARPYASNSPLQTAFIWGVKIPGFVLYTVTGGRWIYPFASAIVTYGRRPPVSLPGRG